MAKQKISRPILYTALVAVVAVTAVFLNTQPPAPSTVHVARTGRTTQTADANGILPEDLAAHFPRYNGGKRNPFVPGVSLPLPQTLANSHFGGGGAGWTLTGINSVNGVSSALIENSVTGESVFLQPGDQWNGMRVVTVGTDNVVFQNALGRQDSLTFAQPKEDASGQKLSSVPTVPSAPGVPALPALGTQPLAPYPVTPLQVAPRQTPFPDTFAPDDAGSQDNGQNDNSQSGPQVIILGGPLPDDNSSAPNPGP